MKFLNVVIRALDTFTEGLGKLAAWLSLLMVLVTCYIVFTRYILNEGSIAIQESVIYLNAALFMLTAGFTLRHNGHVRVDIFYSQATPAYRMWVDLLGSLLLLFPVCIFILWVSWDYVSSSWFIHEQSGDAGGLPYVYLLKSLILVMPGLLLLQGLAEILRNVRLLTGRSDQAPPVEQGNSL